MAGEKKELLPGQSEDGDLVFPFSFPLTKPIPGDGRRVEALELREPTGDDVIKFNLFYGLNGENAVKVIGALADVSDVAIGQMAGRDLMRLTVVLERFFSAAVR